MTQDRQQLIDHVQDAIRKGRAFLNTAFGRRKVIGYNDATGNAVTLNDNDDRLLGQQSFLVTLEAIEVQL